MIRFRLLIPFLLALITETAFTKVLPDEMNIQHTGKKPAISRASLNNKVSVLNFWATWCSSCKVELKEMKESFNPLFKDERFQFAMISLDTDPEKARTWVQENMPEMAPYLYKDPEFVAAEAFQVETFPMTAVIGPTGKMVAVHQGFKPGQTAKITETVKKILSEQSPSETEKTTDGTLD